MNSTLVQSTLTHDLNFNESIFRGASYILLGIFVIFTNCMVIYSYINREKSKRGVPDIFILNFAVSSILTCVAVLFVVAYARLAMIKTRDRDWLCHLQCILSILLRLTDVGTTTGIALDRFFAVYKPIFYRIHIKNKYGYFLCAFLWGFCIIIACLPSFGFGGINVDLLSICSANWNSSYSIIILVMTYVQFIIVLICYIGIFNCIKGLIGRKKAMMQSQTVNYQDNKVCSDAAQVQKQFDISSMSNSVSNDTIKEEDDDVFIQEDAVGHNTFTTSKIFAKSGKTEENARTKTVYKSQSFQNISRKNKPLVGDKGYKITSKDLSLRTLAVINRVSEDNKLNDVISCEELKLKVTAKSLGKELDLINGNDELRRQSCPSKIIIGKNKHENSRSLSFGKETRMKMLSGLMSKKWKNLALRRRMPSNVRHIKENQRFAKIMAVVVTIFYISWLPLAISINVVFANILSPEKEQRILWIGYNISMLSAITIPMAYPVMCKPYRIGYIHIRSWLGLCCQKKS